MRRRPPRGRILRGAGVKVIPPLGREAQKGFSVGLPELSRKARFQMAGSQLMNGRASCDCGFFSLLVQTRPTRLHLTTHVHLPSLDFFFPQQSWEKKIAIPETFDINWVWGVMTQGSCWKWWESEHSAWQIVFEYLVWSKRVLRANNGVGTSLQKILETGWHL